MFFLCVKIMCVIDRCGHGDDARIHASLPCLLACQRPRFSRKNFEAELGENQRVIRSVFDRLSLFAISCYPISSGQMVRFLLFVLRFLCGASARSNRNIASDLL